MLVQLQTHTRPHYSSYFTSHIPNHLFSRRFYITGETNKISILRSRLKDLYFLPSISNSYKVLYFLPFIFD
jgi:hypothetical protein